MESSIQETGAALAAHANIPAAYRERENVEAGGLMSYGPSSRTAWGLACVRDVMQITKRRSSPALPYLELSIHFSGGLGALSTHYPTTVKRQLGLPACF
jgi:hypothetical protein